MSLLQTSADISVLINSESTSSERRINPSWTIALLKSKLLPVTGIPPSSQQLTLRLPHSPQPIAIASKDEETTQIGSFPLQPYAEIHVDDTRPPSARLNLTDTSEVEKYVMPEEDYSKRNDSVLAWKKRSQLGRFDPNKEANEAKELKRQWSIVEARGISIGKRCRIGGAEAGRRGAVRYIGEVPEIPAAPGSVWIGFEADEPTGKNDGSVGGKSYFTCKPKHGSFVRPERVEMGDFPEVDDLDDLEEM
ncbi:CAP Gly-rich domain-containing protein [Geopyxis carbonaria]|nr:CAP Gly-rich domain-containing protein [Geopyxis carbonaria]